MTSTGDLHFKQELFCRLGFEMFIGLINNWAVNQNTYRSPFKNT